MCTCHLPEGDEDGRGPCTRAATCSDSDCVWPTNINLGRCTFRPVSTLYFVPPYDDPAHDAHWEVAYHPGIDYCDCQGQGTTMVSAMDGCTSTLRLCPNQVGLGAGNWDSAIATTLGPACPTALPRLPYFEACGLTTFTGSNPSRTHFSDMDNYTIRTFCTCNYVGETGSRASSYVIETVDRECDGGYICHNSVGFVTGKPKANKRVPERTSTATAASPLLAVTTDATPGSAPMAPGPTVLMAD
jgi:hypothetical protein